MAQYEGTLQVGANAVPITVSGSPTGRITVRVGARVVFDKKPFIAKESYEFSVYGKSGRLKWLQAGLMDVDCEISIDGKTATLSRLTEAGRVKPPLDVAAREKVMVRNYGFGLVALALGSILFNYFSVSRDGTYYPKLLGTSPLMMLMGIILTVKQPTSKEPPTQRMWWWMIAGAVVMCIVGWLFSQWFIRAFAPVN